ncbi:MAG: dipicolinate synthase subunit DpsA [Clostridia bacterium]
MKNRYLVLGGDLRNIKLAGMLADDGNRVYSFGQDRSDEILDDGRIEKCTSLKAAMEKAQVIIGPVPFSSNEDFINAPFAHDKIMIDDLMKSNKSKIFISGSIKDDLKKQLDEKYMEVIDIMKRDDLAILNTIATAEGTIEVAIKNTDKILQGSRVLILGFGRVGKIVANKFSKMSAIVTCAARKVSDLAWIKAYGYNSLNINDMLYDLKEFDIIINTVPQTILRERELKHIDAEALLIDLASSPGGIDGKMAKSMGLNFIWALALPGRIAPSSSAKFIKDTVYTIIEEMSKRVE